MEIISRKDAIKQGLRYYYTGKPCKNYHMSQRITRNYECKACHDERYFDDYMNEKQNDNSDVSLHDVKMFIINNTAIRAIPVIAKTLGVHWKLAQRAMRELNIQQSKKPEHYVG